MNKKEKAKQLLVQIESLQNPQDTFKDSFIAAELASVSDRLKSNPIIRTLQKFNADLQKLQNEIIQVRTDFDFAPIQQSIRQVQKELKLGDAGLLAEFEAKLRNLPPDLTQDLDEAIVKLRAEFELRIANLPQPENLEPELENIRQQLQDIVSAAVEEDKKERDELEKEKAELDKRFENLRKEIMNRINNIGGGAMNRQILFNSVDYLKRYTDINYKAGANITFTIANNDQTKKVDVTISATGGSGSGIVRSINSIAADTAAAASATTDYVYLVSGTTTLTLPDATTNTNLYTIKNVGTGVVTIATTGGQTIDGNATITMATRFTSVDLISDTANWSIT